VHTKAHSISNKKVLFLKVSLLLKEREKGDKFGRVWSEEVLVIEGDNIVGETESMLISEAIEDNWRGLRCHTVNWRHEFVLSMFLVVVIKFLM